MEQILITNAVKIVNQRVKSFDGEREYLATGGLVGNSVITEKVTYKNKPSRADLLARENQLIIARMKETNKVFLVDNNISNYIFSTGFLALEAKNGWNPKFLYHFFQSKYFQKQKDNLSSGATQKAINNEKFKEILIPEITIEDQKRIVKILDQVDSLRQKRKQSIKLLDEYLKSVFQEMFGDPRNNPMGWKIESLTNVCSSIVDCPHSTPSISDTVTNYACIRTSELKNGFISWNSMKYVNESEYKKRIIRLAPVEGDIVYGREGSFGEAIRIPDSPKFCLGQRTMLLRPNKEKICSEYLWTIVRSDYVYEQAFKKTSGSTVAHVNVKDIKEFKILLPPLIKQYRYKELLEKSDKLKDIMVTQYQELENNFQALIQKAFKGELI